jgi:hypothetical protein
MACSLVRVDDPRAMDLIVADDGLPSSLSRRGRMTIAFRVLEGDIAGKRDGSVDAV